MESNTTETAGLDNSNHSNKNIYVHSNTLNTPPAYIPGTITGGFQMVNDQRDSAYPLSSKALSKNSVKKLMLSYTNDGTQITSDAVESMQKILIEHTRWIVNEAEKLTTYEGSKRIKETHIRDAVKTYFGIRKKNEGGM